MSEPKVVGLRGNTVYDVKPEVCETIVETLKAELVRAEAGEIIGMFLVTLDRNAATTGFMVGKASGTLFGRTFSMLSKHAAEYEEED